MKAKDYVRDIQNLRDLGIPEVKIVITTLNKLREEAVKIGIQRAQGRNPNDRVILGVMREQDLKFRSIAYRVGWNPNGWSIYAENYIAMQQEEKSPC